MGWSQVGSAFVFISPSSGLILVYSGIPANGNLAIAIAASGGTDAYGNTYNAGLNLFGTSSTSAGASSINFPISISSTLTGAFILAYIVAANTSGEIGALQLFGPKESAFPDAVSVNLFSSTKGGPANAQGVLYYWNTLGVATQILTWLATGVSIVGTLSVSSDVHVGGSLFGAAGTLTIGDNVLVNTGKVLNAAHPGSAGVAETWQAFPAFAAGFAHGTPAPMYKYMADNTVMLAGAINVNAGVTAGTLISGAFVSTFYNPISVKRFAVVITAGTPPVSGSPQISISTSGALALFNGPTVAAYTISLDGLSFPLDY